MDSASNSCVPAAVPGSGVLKMDRLGFHLRAGVIQAGAQYQSAVQAWSQRACKFVGRAFGQVPGASPQTRRLLHRLAPSEANGFKLAGPVQVRATAEKSEPRA